MVGVGFCRERRAEGDHRGEGLPESRDGRDEVRAPETVSVAMAELAEDIREGLLALAVGAGL
jgi:hypothetical protein